MIRSQNFWNTVFLFALAIAALAMFGWNQNPEMRTFATFCLGGFFGYVARTGEKTDGAA